MHRRLKKVNTFFIILSAFTSAVRSLAEFRFRAKKIIKSSITHGCFQADEQENGGNELDAETDEHERFSPGFLNQDQGHERHAHVHGAHAQRGGLRIRFR